MALTKGGLSRRKLVHALAGLEVGMVGAVAVLGWFVLRAALHGQAWFAIPNLLGSTFYGDLAFRAGAGKVTLAGIALHFLISGTLGCVFGLIIGPVRNAPLVSLSAIGVALGWYLLFFNPFWRAVNPLVMVYSPDVSMLIAHGIYGGFLAGYPAAVYSLERAAAEGRKPPGHNRVEPASSGGGGTPV